ncbi:MAG: MFS transporter, partial [Thermodesulfobium narugense]
MINNLNFSKSQIIVLLILWSAFLFSFVDRLAWAPVIPLAAKALSLNAKEAGSYMSAFYFGYILTQLPGGYLADRFGYRKILLYSFFIMGFFTILMGTVGNFWQGFFYRIFAGMGSGAIFSACVKGVFDWFSEKNRYTAMGFFMTASSVGVFLVNIFVPTVAKFHGWNASFYVAGTLPIITLLFAYFFLCENSSSNETKSILSFGYDIKILLKNKEFMLTGLA